MRRLRLFSIGCDLLDLRGVARYSEIDGIHVDADGHAAVADAVLKRIRALSRVHARLSSPSPRPPLSPRGGQPPP